MKHYIVTRFNIKTSRRVDKNYVHYVQEMAIVSKNDYAIIDIPIGYQYDLINDIGYNFNNSYNPFISLKSKIIDIDFLTVLSDKHKAWGKYGFEYLQINDKLWIMNVHDNNLMNRIYKGDKNNIPFKKFNITK